MKKYFLLTPGPTPIPPEVAQKESLPILHHRTSEYGEIFSKVLDDMKYVFQTKNTVLLMSCSGTGAMESAVVNLLNPQDKVIVASCGVFGNRWEKICKAYNVNVIKIDAQWGKSVEPEKIEIELKNNPDVKVVFTTHTETSTGVVNDLKKIGEIVSKTDKILVVDAISGLAGQDLKTDEWNIDVVVSGSQKGLMCAPGLAFVSINEKAWKLVENSKLPKFYFDYKKMRDYIPKKQTPFTPAVSLVVSLSKSLDIIKNQTLEKIFIKTENLAKITREAIKALNLKLFADEKCACNVLTSVNVPEGIDGKKIVKILREEYGISIAGGQEKLEGKIIRIAHMGYIDKFDLFVAFIGLEIVLTKLGYRIEPGKSIAVAENFG